MLEVKEIKRRYKKAQTHKEQWRSIYEEAYEYAPPMRTCMTATMRATFPARTR